MAKRKCGKCNGTGYQSAARESGTETLPVMHRQIGVFLCQYCRGDGTVGFDFTPEKLKELSEMAKALYTSQKQGT